MYALELLDWKEHQIHSTPSRQKDLLRLYPPPINIQIYQTSKLSALSPESLGGSFRAFHSPLTAFQWEQEMLKIGRKECECKALVRTCIPGRGSSGPEQHGDSQASKRGYPQPGKEKHVKHTTADSNISPTAQCGLVETTWLLESDRYRFECPFNYGRTWANHLTSLNFHFLTMQWK